MHCQLRAWQPEKQIIYNITEENHVRFVDYGNITPENSENILLKH